MILYERLWRWRRVTNTQDYEKANQNHLTTASRTSGERETIKSETSFSTIDYVTSTQSISKKNSEQMQQIEQEYEQTG